MTRTSTVFISLFLTGCLPLADTGSDTGSPEASSAQSTANSPDQGCPPVDKGIGFVQSPGPNVMLVVDRSCSMQNDVECLDRPCGSRWDQLLSLGDYVDDVTAQAAVGLSVFPDNTDDCSAEHGLRVPISDDPATSAEILRALAETEPAGATPMAAAIDFAASNDSLQDPNRDNVVVLLTDGKPRCGADDDEAVQATVAAVDHLVSLPEPIELYVIGFDTDPDATATLQSIATAAESTSGTDNFYEASTTEDLVNRLYSVSAQLVECEYTLADVVAAGELLVWLDDAQVEPCYEDRCESGYTYTPDTGMVRLEGATCLGLQDGVCHELWFEKR